MGFGLALLAALLTASPAAAREDLARDTLRSGPFLADGGAVWTRGPYAGDVEVLAAASGQPPRVIHHARRSGGGLEGIAVTAGDGGLAVGHTTYKESTCGRSLCPYPVSSRLLAGPLAGPLAEVTRCDRQVTSRTAAIDAGRLVYAYGCSFSDPERIMLRDLQTGDERVLSVVAPQRFERMVLAGRYLAIQGFYDSPSGGQFALSVNDVETGAEVYRVSGRTFPSPFEWDLQADGKLATASYESPPAGNVPGVRLGWFSPQEPSLHALPVQPSFDSVGPADVAMENDHIVFERPVSPCSSHHGWELAVTDLQGNVRVIGPTAPKPMEEFLRFGFDGRTVVWPVPVGSGEMLVARQDLYQEPPPADVADRTCPPMRPSQLSMSSRPVRLRSSRIPLRLTCRPRPESRPYACVARVFLRTVARLPGGRGRERRRIALAADLVRVDSGATCTVRLPLRARARRPLAGRRSVLVEATLRDYGSLVGTVSEDGRPVRIRFRLRLPRTPRSASPALATC